MSAKLAPSGTSISEPLALAALSDTYFMNSSVRT